MGRLRIAALILLAVLVAVMLAFSGSNSAQSATVKRHDRLPLHAGSYGQRVADLQWLLAGHRPNVFTKVKPTFKGKPNGALGSRTKHAIVAYKFRIGYPGKGQCGARATLLVPTAGRLFFDLLEGKRQRPICWVALAQQRVQLVVPGATKTALAIKALEISQLGVHEIPDGSNRGPCISVECLIAGHRFDAYQGSTGAFGAPWCASFQQWAFWLVTSSYFADRSAGVLYIEHWAQQRGYLNAKASVGGLVAFLDDGGHIGYITKVLASGYVTIEGNEGNAVKQVYHPWNDRLRVFINLPGLVA